MASKKFDLHRAPMPTWGQFYNYMMRQKYRFVDRIMQWESRQHGPTEVHAYGCVWTLPIGALRGTRVCFRPSSTAAPPRHPPNRFSAVAAR